MDQTRVIDRNKILVQRASKFRGCNAHQHGLVKMSMQACFAKLVCSVKEGGVVGRPPLVRSRTLPAIVVPGVSNTTELAQLDRREGGGGGLYQQRIASEDCPIRPVVTITAHDDDGLSRSRNRCRSPQSPTAGSPGGLKVPGSQGLGRIARLLTKENRGSDSYRRRTHSLESKLGPNTLRRAASIDSLVDVNTNNNNNNNNKNSVNTSLLMTHSNGVMRPMIPGSPAITKKHISKEKSTPYLSPGWSTMDVFVDSLNLSKGGKKRLEKINKINIHLEALFAAVEHGQQEKAKNILDNNSLDINNPNDDGLNVLEIAAMHNNYPIVKLLQHAGAKESNSGPFEKRVKHMDELIHNTNRKREDLSIPYTKDAERQKALWDRKFKMLRKMKAGLEKIEAPGPPSSAIVEVIDGTRVRVTFQEPNTSVITTKFKVEWSEDDWKSISGCLELRDLRRMSAIIEDLTQGRRYHFRVAAGNLKDYGNSLNTLPPSVIPSSWRDTDNRRPRLEGLLRELGDLFNQVRNSRPEHASEIKAIETGQETPMNQRKAQKKKSLMQLFTPAPKFQKNLKRGSYLACIMFSEDKVLLTTEDFPPVIEVDENFLSQAKTHFLWLMKVATTWEDVKSLRQDMEQAGSASRLPYRIKLLQAAANMQSALGVQDLGQFYHHPIKDSNGTLVFCTVKHIRSTKSISAMNVKWVPISKLKEKKTSIISNPGAGNSEAGLQVGDMLLSSIPDQKVYNQVNQVPLRRGLYLAYMKLQSSVEELQVVTHEKYPNMFPHIKIRDNPHVSREEWEWVQSLGRIENNGWNPMGNPNHPNDLSPSKFSSFPIPTAAQHVWHSQLVQSVHQLLEQLSLDEGDQGCHRLYTGEVLELNSEVTIILLLPPVESVCCVPGQEDPLLTQPGFMALPLHTFEMVHMGTYQCDLLGRYARLSYILEMDILMAQHASREAFSQTEVKDAKDRLCQLNEFQSQLETIWRKFRWVMDSINFARDKSVPGLAVVNLYANVLLSDSRLSNENSHLSTVISHELYHSSNESLQLGTENKRLRKDDNFNFRTKKSDGSRLLKSNTAENIRVLSNNDVRFPKSKTTECLYQSSHNQSKPSSVDCVAGEQNENMPLLSWSTEMVDTKPPLDASLYYKDQPKTRSDYHLQRCIEHIPLPRKCSAPSFLDSQGGSLKICSADSKLDKHDTSISLESVDNSSVSCKQKKENNSEVEDSFSTNEEKSPSGSCFDLNQHYNSNNSVEIRAGSSLSHESEASFSSMTPSLRSLSSNETETDTLSLLSKESGRSEASEAKSTEGEETADGSRKPEEPAIIQVYAAYDTGLASGTSVKLHVTHRTTAREIIDIVVKQLNMAVIYKGKDGPIYGNDKLKNFCLAAVIGARERCLRDDIRPLSLQHPWKKGRLYVRLKSEVLAAIQQCKSRHLAYL